MSAQPSFSFFLGRICIGTTVSIFLLSAAAISQIFEWRYSTPSGGSCLEVNPHNPSSIYTATPDGRLSHSSDHGKGWAWLNPIGITDVRQILVHPSDTSTIFAVGENGSLGLRRSTNNGVSWTTVLADYEIDGESMTLDPVHPDTMYAGHIDGRIYRSTNRGANWTQVGSLNSFLCSMVVRPDSVNIVIAGSGNSRISRSTDFGATWSTVRPVVSPQGFEVPKIIIDPNDPMKLYAATYGYKAPLVDACKSTDGGLSWTNTTPTGWPNWGMALGGSNFNILYTGTFLAESLTAVFKSTNGGTSWSMITKGLPESYLWNFKADPLDSNGLWLALRNEYAIGGGIYHLGATLTGIRGAVLDATTNDTIKNGSAELSNFLDEEELETSSGTFEFGKFPSDYSIQTIHVEAYPYVSIDYPVTFINDSILHRDIQLERLPVASIGGRLRDITTHLPVKGHLTLFTTTSLGSFTSVTATDDSGYYSFPAQFITFAGINRHDSLVIDPDFPYAHATIKQLYLDTMGLSFVSDLEVGDILIVGATGGGNYLSWYQKALPAYKVVYWNTSTLGIPPLSQAGLFKKNVVIYYSGVRHTPLAQQELDSLAACVRAGTNLLVTGQDIVEKNESSEFVHDILGVSYGGLGLPIAKGNSDEILNGLQFFIGSSDGANNQTSWDALNVLNPQARVILRYGGAGQGGIAGVRLYNPETRSKIVLFGSGVEAFAGEGTRQSVLNRVITYLTSADIDIAIAARHGWNLVSRSVAAFNENRVGVYPTANSEAYRYGTSYEIDPQIHLGFGYWLRFPAPQIVLTTGEPVERETIAVHQGWNLIGSISQPVPVEDILQVPPGIISSPLYSFDDAYALSPTTIPGRGVWVKTTSAGSLILSPAATGISKNAMAQLEGNQSTLIFEDAAHRIQKLVFGNANQAGGTGELPPVPPEGAFDVRFADNTFSAGLNTPDHPISISSAQYPLSIRWKSNPENSSSSLHTDRISVHLRGEGTIMLPEEQQNVRLSVGTLRVPFATKLIQNYPNPFNPSTEIKFEIRNAGLISLKVFDILGKEVAELINEEKEPGSYSVLWEAGHVSSGIYFYELRAGEFKEVKKMLLVR